MVRSGERGEERRGSVLTATNKERERVAANAPPLTYRMERAKDTCSVRMSEPLVVCTCLFNVAGTFDVKNDSQASL